MKNIFRDMNTSLVELYTKAGEGVQKLLNAGISISEIFQYDITEEQFNKFHKILSDEK